MPLKISELKESDKTKTVIYRPKQDPLDYEIGSIVRWNDKFIFVKYGNTNILATYPEDLEFEF